MHLNTHALYALTLMLAHVFLYPHLFTDSHTHTSAYTHCNTSMLTPIYTRAHNH